MPPEAIACGRPAQAIPVGEGNTARPAAFLDRDGVINLDRGYVCRIEDMAFTATAIEGIRLLNEAGHHVVVVTNQSGVARGYFDVRDVDRLHRHMQADLARSGARIDAFYFCPHHPDGKIAEFTGDHPDRKPRPGMLLRAMRDLAIRREGSFLIGDKPSDVAAAEAAGLPGILVPKDSCDLAAVVRHRLRL